MDFENPYSRISETVRYKSKKEFGPEGLPQERIAAALNIEKGKITPEEWMEIYEFAVNAGVDLIQGTIKQNVPEAAVSGDIKALRSSIKGNEAGLIPHHDIFHAAETYRLTGGRKASAEFVETDIRSRYADPSLAVSELYPVLFLVSPPNLDEPLPVALSHPEGRKHAALFLKGLLDTALPSVREAITVLERTDAPATPAERRREYEGLVELIVTANAIRRLQDMDPHEEPLTESEHQAIHEALKEARRQPAPHYEVFAAKVFAQTDYNRTPRLFLDEFLVSIRSFNADKPEELL